MQSICIPPCRVVLWYGREIAREMMSKKQATSNKAKGKMMNDDEEERGRGENKGESVKR